jgi:hypothetical protein
MRISAPVDRAGTAMTVSGRWLDSAFWIRRTRRAGWHPRCLMGSGAAAPVISARMVLACSPPHPHMRASWGMEIAGSVTGGSERPAPDARRSRPRHMVTSMHQGATGCVFQDSNGTRINAFRRRALHRRPAFHQRAMISQGRRPMTDDKPGPTHDDKPAPSSGDGCPALARVSHTPGVNNDPRQVA